MARSVQDAPSWKRSLAQAIRDPDALIHRLQLDASLREPARAAAEQFPLLVPESFAARMRLGDPDDPLLRQVLPIGAELDAVPGYSADPLAEAEAVRAPGLLQKYAGRALLITTGVCAVHCRYCFRRHFPYESTPRSLSAWEPALTALAEDSTTKEVILSGGDPLLLPDALLRNLIARLAQVSHVERLRIHTRLPIVLPDRVTSDLITLLRETRLTPVIVVHANHPAELDRDCGPALEAIVDAGVPTLNQAVLLRGVNDSEETLVELCRRLLALRVLPYYLHQLDAVAGAAHFFVSPERGGTLVEGMRRRLPGYGVPKYVQEVAGAASKLPIIT